MKIPAVENRYLAFSSEIHAEGSNTAPSYVAALKKIDTALHLHGVFLAPNESVWEIRDVERLATLYEFVKSEQKKSNGGVFCNEPSKSYWKKGFCSAAVKDFSQFLTLTDRQNSMLKQFETASDAQQLAQELENVKIIPNPLLIPDDIAINTPEGKSKLKEVQVRQNQHIFRKMILSIYQGQCCLTGLPVQEVLRASHITEWAKDKKNRMNPENGLCLSATYDAAFDRHLISFDEDYRLIFAPSLKEHYTNEAFKEQFQRLYGKKIAMPIKFLPSQELLAKHREHLA
jgi:putative restriction endonuclease